MQAFRQIYSDITDNLHIPLPIEFQHCKLEVIILPIEEKTQSHQTAAQALQHFLDTKDVEALSDLKTEIFSQDRKLGKDRKIDL